MSPEIGARMPIPLLPPVMTMVRPSRPGTSAESNLITPWVVVRVAVRVAVDVRVGVAVAVIVAVAVGVSVGMGVAVPVLSRIANFDDLDPLRAEPGVRVEFVQPGDPLPGDAHLVVLPGSKATRAAFVSPMDVSW